MAIPKDPATPEQMQVEALKELDRMRMMSIQSLAMQRIRDSVMTLSRETGFRERPVEAFSQAPLYIPQYQQWSNTLGKLVGTPAPTAPEFARPGWRSLRSASGVARQTSRDGVPFVNMPGIYANRPKEYQAWIDRARAITSQAEAWSTYDVAYANWQQAQRNLPT